ncbi:MAG: hypothetical protein PHF84_03370 [bacterium]|nr:hypothetical protein [bacterium]
MPPDQERTSSGRDEEIKDPLGTGLEEHKRIYREMKKHLVRLALKLKS